MSICIKKISEREYRDIAISTIDIATTRKRKKEVLAENARSVEALGLYKPIIVNRRNFESTGKYRLICGEGRVLAHKALSRETIRAEIVDVDEDVAYIMMLGENVARTKMQPMELARSIKQMHEEGVSLDEMARIMGKSEDYIVKYLNLVRFGDDRLMQGVHTGLFPITFALQIAQASSNAELQRLLMDAFDAGVIDGSNVGRVRRMIKQRCESMQSYSLKDLKYDIQRLTKEKQTFVDRAQQCERKVLLVLSVLSGLDNDVRFKSLLVESGLKIPDVVSECVNGIR